jgi:hypothetical protein
VNLGFRCMVWKKEHNGEVGDEREARVVFAVSGGGSD